MAISEPYTNTTSAVGTTEYSLPSNSTTGSNITTDGVFQLFVDPAAMLAGDTFIFRVKEKAISGGTQRTVYESWRVGVQLGLFVTPSLILLHGWDMTIQKSAGTDRAFPFSIRQVA